MRRSGRRRALGVITWGVLLLILRGERRDVRAQVAIVILVATAMEYTASGLVGLYTYRLENVPLFVPPGHGLLYLTALALGRSQLFAVLRRPVIVTTIAIGGAWAIWGLALSPRSDLLGAIFFVCLVGFLIAGRAPLVYAGAFIVCSYLELMGTAVGTWAWATHDPTGSSASAIRPAASRARTASSMRPRWPGRPGSSASPTRSARACGEAVRDLA